MSSQRAEVWHSTGGEFFVVGNVNYEYASPRVSNNDLLMVLTVLGACAVLGSMARRHIRDSYGRQKT